MCKYTWKHTFPHMHTDTLTSGVSTSDTPCLSRITKWEPCTLMASLKETSVNGNSLWSESARVSQCVFFGGHDRKFPRVPGTLTCISHCLSSKGGTDTLTITVLCARQCVQGNSTGSQTNTNGLGEYKGWCHAQVCNTPVPHMANSFLSCFKE